MGEANDEVEMESGENDPTSEEQEPGGAEAEAAPAQESGSGAADLDDGSAPSMAAGQFDGAPLQLTEPNPNLADAAKSKPHFDRSGPSELPSACGDPLAAPAPQDGELRAPDRCEAQPASPAESSDSEPCTPTPGAPDYCFKAQPFKVGPLTDSPDPRSLGRDDRRDAADDEAKRTRPKGDESSNPLRDAVKEKVPILDDAK